MIGMAAFGQDAEWGWHRSAAMAMCRPDISSIAVHVFDAAGGDDKVPKIVRVWAGSGRLCGWSSVLSRVLSQPGLQPQFKVVICLHPGGLERCADAVGN